MLNPNIYYTERRPDYTCGGIKKKINERSPVKSPVSRSARLLQIFQNIIQSIPLPSILLREFPLIVQDWRISSRGKEILGMPQDKKMHWGGIPYCVLGKEVHQWLQEFENMIGRSCIEAEYIVGSAAAYVAGQPLLREALDTFLLNIPDNHPKKAKFFAKMVGKIAQKEFSFADVDLRIKVNSNYPLEKLQSQINQLKGCRTDLFDGKVLIVYVGELEEKALDIVIYTELDTESAFNLDDFKVDILRSNFERNQIVFHSTNPWKWWMGHTLGLLEDNTGDGFRCLPRLLWQLSKSKVSIQKTESAIFPIWIEKMNYKLKLDKTALRTQCEKHQQNHERLVPLANCLLRLRLQQLIRNNSSELHFALKEAANTPIHKTDPSFIKALFHVMQEKGSDIAAVHALIECIAYLALYEAWNKPFEVKLVKHEGEWVQRIRFRGTFGKRDLLVRFNIPASLDLLNKVSKDQWKKMRVIIHSLWFEELNQREEGLKYKRKLEKLAAFPSAILEIRKKIFEKTSIKKGDVDLAKQPSLASLEISWSQKVKYLLEVGKIVFNHYHHDLSMRYQLCWKIVYKCIELRGFYQTAEFVKMLREGKEEPIDGYTSLFAHVIQKDCDSYLLYQACSPFPTISEEKWMELSQSKSKIPFLISLMNEMDISAELFLEMLRLLKFKNPEIGEKALCKILVYDKTRACKWILEKDKPAFNSNEYCDLVSQCIISSKNSFSSEWIKNTLILRNFIASEEEKIALCKYLLSKPLAAQDKAKILQKLEIKEPYLWQIVANEYISQGETWPDFLDYESLVMWYQIMNNADDTPLVEETLLKIKPPPKGTKDTVRGLVLVRILKNWGKTKKPVDIEILKKLDISKRIPWEEVISQSYTGEDILRKLNHVSLPLYSALFRAIKPVEPFYATFWVNMILEKFPEGKTAELLDALSYPVMTECLQIDPKISLPLYKRIANIKDGIQFIYDNLEKTHVDQELLYKMIEACVDFDDHGVMGTMIFMKFYNPDSHKCNIPFKKQLAQLVQKIFNNPQGDTEAAVRIQKIIKELANPQKLPCKEHFTRLIQHNATDWAIDIINKASPSDLESIPPQIYSRLLNCTKDLDKRCLLLESCQVFSEAVRKHWELLAEQDPIVLSTAIRLLQSVQRLKVPDEKVHKLFVSAVAVKQNTKIILNEQTCRYLLDMLPRIDFDNACVLWEALKKSNSIDKTNLWSTGVDILQRDPKTTHYRVLSWIIQNHSGQPIDKLFTFLQNVIKYPLETRIHSLIFPLVKQEALKKNMNASAIYWALNCDIDISMEELDALNPTLEQYRKTLQRLADNHRREKFAHPAFLSLLNVLFSFRKILNYTNLEDELNTFSNLLYDLLADFIPTTVKEERLKWAFRASNVLLCEKQYLPFSKQLQRLCSVVLDDEFVMSNEDKCTLLLFMKQNHILTDELWKLITPLACCNNETLFGYAIMGMTDLKNIDKCPTSIIFHSWKFPQFIPKIISNISKMKDLPRRDYFKGILLSSLFIHTPSKELALKFIDYLFTTFCYLEQHSREELQEWVILRIHENPYNVVNNNGTPSFELFSRFILITFLTSKPSIFFDEEVLAAFLHTISNFPKNLILQLYFCRIIGYTALDYANNASGFQALTYLKKIAFEEEYSVKRGDPNEIFLSDLYRLMAQLMIKFTPNHKAEQSKLASLILKVNNNNYPEREHLKLESYRAYLTLTGDMDGFYAFLPNLKSISIAEAIIQLCNNPHQDNLDKAYKLLLEGTHNVLHLYDNNLREANKHFVRAILKSTHEKNISAQITQLFLHLCNPKKIDCFEQSKETIEDHLFKLCQCYENSRGGPIDKTKKRYTTSANPDTIRAIRLELVHFNISEILKSNHIYLPSLIGLLNISIFTFLAATYVKYPNELKMINELLIEGCLHECPKNDFKRHAEIAVLLCSHPYFPIDPWLPFFAEKNQEELFNTVKIARFYSDTLQKCRGNRPQLLELCPTHDKSERQKKPYQYDAQLASKYQWIRETIKVFKNEPYDDDTFKWMNHIQKELVHCLYLSSKATSIESITTSVLSILELVISINGLISRKNPAFANAWIGTFLNELDPLFDCEFNKWFLSIIDEKLQILITLELLPSLPLIERFSAKLSQEHKNRNCIDALHKLLSLGCKEDHIIDKALIHLDKLEDKTMIMPSNRAIKVRSVIYEIVANVDYIIKFELIYMVGIKRILERLKQNNDKKLFIHQLRNFRLRTETCSIRFDVTSHLPEKVFAMFYEQIECLVDEEVITEVMDLLLILFQLLKMKEHESTYAFANALKDYMMLAVLTGRDTKYPSSNKYILAIRQAMLTGFSIANAEFFTNFDKIPNLLKCSFLIQDDYEKSSFIQACISKSTTDPLFCNVYVKVLNEVIQDMEYFIKICPERKEWYHNKLTSAAKEIGVIQEAKSLGVSFHHNPVIKY